MANSMRIAVCLELILLLIGDVCAIIEQSNHPPEPTETDITNNYPFKPGHRSIRSVEQYEYPEVKFEFNNGTDERDQLATEVSVHVVMAHISEFNIAGFEDQKNATEIFGNVSKLMTTFFMEGEAPLSIQEAKQIAGYLQWKMHLKRLFSEDLWNYEFKMRGKYIKIKEIWRKLVNRIFDWKYRDVNKSNFSKRKRIIRKKKKDAKKYLQVKNKDDIDTIDDNPERLVIERQERMKSLNLTGKSPIYKENMNRFDRAIMDTLPIVKLKNATEDEYLLFRTGHHYLANETLNFRKEGYKLIRDLFVESWDISFSTDSHADHLKNWIFSRSACQDIKSNPFLCTVIGTGKFLDFDYVDGNNSIIPSTEWKTIGKFINKKSSSESKILMRVIHILNGIMRLIHDIEESRGNLFVNNIDGQIILVNPKTDSVELQELEYQMNIKLSCSQSIPSRNDTGVTELFQKIEDMIQVLVPNTFWNHSLESSSNGEKTSQLSFGAIDLIPDDDQPTVENEKIIDKSVQQWIPLVVNLYKLNHCTMEILKKKGLELKNDSGHVGESEENSADENKTVAHLSNSTIFIREEKA